MTEPFHLDVQAMTPEMRKLGGMSERLAQATNKLVGDLEPHEGCWGEDDIGKGFAKDYVPHCQQTIGEAKQATQGVGNVAGGVQRIVNQFQQIDQANAERVRRAGNYQR
jgi:hypothetical protein